MPLAVTSEDFAALVADLRAELAAASRLRREEILHRAGKPPTSFGGRPWTAFPVDLREAADLTGYSWYTLHAFTAPSAARWHPWARFPAPVLPRLDGAGRKWRAGDLAIWAADRDPANGQANLVRFTGKPPGKGRAPRDLSGLTCRPTSTRRNARRRVAAVTFAAGLIEASPAITMREVKAAAEASGVTWHYWRAAMDQARAAALPRILEGVTPRDPSGHATAAEIAAAFGISRGKVAGAMRRGEIRSARHGRAMLADPGRLRFRKQTQRATMPAPADKDHPAAVPLPEDQEETS